MIARTDAERHSVIRGRVARRRARDEKGRTRERAGCDGERTGEKCDVAQRLGIAIRNAAVAIADHSEATARIAISWRVLRHQDLAQSNRLTLERRLASPRLQHQPDNQHPYFPLTKAVSFRNSASLVSFADPHLDSEQTEDGSRPLPFSLALLRAV